MEQTASMMGIKEAVLGRFKMDLRTGSIVVRQGGDGRDDGAIDQLLLAS